MFVGGPTYTGTWSIVSPGTMLVVGTASNGSIWTYNVNGNTLTYTSSSDGSNATLTK